MVERDSVIARGLQSRPSIVRAVIMAAMGAAICMLLLITLALGVALADGVTPTNTWVNLYSSHSTFAGLPIPAGATVAVFDPQGAQCGEQTVSIAGHIAPLMPCYGDDPFTPADEGPVQGEPLYFTLNGLAVVPQAVGRNFVPVAPGTPVTWADLALWQINLVVPPRPPVTATLQANALQMDWQPAGADITLYEIWRATAPDFAPGDMDAEQPGSVTPGAGVLNWSSGAGVGVPEVNYIYRVRSLNAFSQTVGISQAVAEFDFALYAP